MQTNFNYLAGFFDGDGSIAITRRKAISGHYLSETATIGCTDESIVRIFYEVFGGHFRTVNRERNGHKNLYQWTIAGTRTARFIEVMTGRLFLKASQLELAREIQDSKRLFGNKPTQDAKNNRESLRVNISTINRTYAPTVEGREPTIAYIAGIFDAEGSVQIRKQFVGDRPQYQVAITISNKNRWLLEKFSRRFGGSVSGVVSRECPCFTWQCQARKAHRFLSLVAPFLTVKKERAVIALGFRYFIRPRPRKLRDPLFTGKMQGAFETIRALNKRGA